MFESKDLNFGAPIKSGEHANLTATIALGIDSNGDALLASNASGAGVVCRGFSLTTGVEGSGNYERNKSRIALVRAGKIAGFSGLTIGDDVWLGVDGVISSTVTVGIGKTKQSLGFATAADTIIVEIGKAEVLT